MVAQQAEMEEIISSIRTTLAEETAKVGGSNADLLDAAAAEDDVLELTASEMVEVPSAAPAAQTADDLVDINAFANTGEAKPADGAAGAEDDLLGEPLAAAPAAPPVEIPAVAVEIPVAEVAPVEAPAQGVHPAEAADEFDKLLAQISSDQKQQVAVAEEQKQALLAEEEPLGDLPGRELPSVEEGADDTGVSARPEVAMVAGISGNQVTLPAEVLAMALRPMVQDWLRENLSSVVEKLVKDEISKLNQG
jgi:cell pole-organizing protein PopZ